MKEYDIPGSDLSTDIVESVEMSLIDSEVTVTSKSGGGSLNTFTYRVLQHVGAKMSRKGPKKLKKKAENDQNWPFQPQNDLKLNFLTKKRAKITCFTQKRPQMTVFYPKL